MAASATQPGLTPQQDKAITTRDTSVALSAGAGCGKTFVLTQRFLSHLEQAGAEELGRYVAITFTDRAAREMRDRIRRGCEDRIRQAADEQLADHWLRILRELDSARISTIHAFCGALLRSHAVEAGLDPRFQTLDQTQSATLRTEFLEDEIRSLLANRDLATMDLVVQFGLEQFRTMIGLLLDRRQQIDWDHWLGKSADEVLEIWRKFHADEVLPATLNSLAASADARTMLRILQDDPCRHKVFQERRQVLLEMLPRLAESQQPAADLAAIRDSAKVQGAGTKRDWDDEGVYMEYKEAAELFRKQIDRLESRLTFDVEAARPSAVAGLQLLAVTAPIARGFDQHKLEKGCLDFDDLLIRARKLLYDPAQEGLRKRLSSQIKLLLVDESQDTDPLQVELIEALCGDGLTTGKLFFVGDFKQSIYRFRKADPKVFRGLRQRMPADGRLPLSRNFRSQPAILHFVNALFCDAFRGEGQEYEPLIPHRPQNSPTPAIEFMWYTPTDNDKTPVSELRRVEADWIARRLRAMLDCEEPIIPIEEPNGSSPPKKGSPAPLRRVKPGDIAILFRALSDVSEYEAALRNYGIAYYLVGGKAFYAQQEVHDLLNLLRTLATPSDEVSLAGVLRSPFFSLADETLYWLSRHPGGLSGGVRAAAAGSPASRRKAAGKSDDRELQLSGEQQERAAFAGQTIAALRAIKDRLPIADLVHEALARTGYDAVLVAEFLGERKLANLHKLIDQARGFDRTGIFTLADFITQLSEFVSQQPDEALAATHPESTDVVRLMSIHQSKGLEFPVVVVPDLNRAMQPKFVPAGFSPQLGPLVRVKEDESSGMCGHDLHAAVESQEEEAERVRLLYVATTRAADYLLLSAGLNKLDAPSSPWMKLLSERFDLETGDFRGVLPADYGPPGPIRVTRTEPAAASQNVKRRPSPKEIVESAESLARAGGVHQPLRTGPIAPDGSARRHYSFSRLSGALEESDPRVIDDEEVLDSVPRRGSPGLDPIRLGILVHDCLATVPLSGRPDASALVAAAGSRLGEHAPAEVAEATALLDRFFRSPRFADLCGARRVHRELEFLLAWPPRPAEQASLAAPASNYYLEGFIDCLYEDHAGRWHLLDYKTNLVDDSNLQSTADGYYVQLAVYSLAVAQTLGQPPASCGLHFLRTGQDVAITPGDADDLVRRVNQAIAKVAGK